MKIVLGKKQTLTPEDESRWWNVIDHIEEYVSQDECEAYTNTAKERIAEWSNDRSVGYSWSGGKDSLVLSSICQSMGITRSWCFITDLEYPAWEKWLREHLPPKCDVIDVNIGLDFLVKRPHMLFAQGKHRQEWNRIVQRNHFSLCMQKFGLDVLFVGHRMIDGNICGKGGVLKKNNGEIRVSPMYDWPHEMIFAYMHYHNIDIPMIYKWRRGFWQGTLWWPHRYVDSIEQGWHEVYEIDPSVVHYAAEKIDSAREFLRRMESR